MSNMQDYTLNDYRSLSTCGKVCVLILLACLLPYLQVSAGIIKHYTHIGKRSGLARNTVSTLAEDIYGQIWIGTDNGLTVYNSNNTYNPEHFSGTHIIKLFNAGTQMIVGTPNYVCAYHYQTGIFSRLKHNGNDIAQTSDILQIDGNTVILAAQQIFRVDSTGILVRICEKASYTRLCIDKFGQLWGINRNDVVSLLNSDFSVKSSYQLKNKELSPVLAFCIFADSKGVIWAGTEKDGLYRYNRLTNNFQKENVYIREGKEIENIVCINEDRDEQLWTGHNTGVAIYDLINRHPEDYIPENTDNVAQNITITDILRTRNGDMVLGTHFTGCFYIHELDSPVKFHKIAKFNKESRLTATNNITEDTQGNLYISTNNAGIIGGNRYINDLSCGINNNIISLAIGATGELWAGSLSNGLYRIASNGRVTHYINRINDPNTLSGNKVYGLMMLRDNSLIIATTAGVDLFLPGRDKFTHLYSGGGFDFLNILKYGDTVYLVDYNSVYRFCPVTHKIEDFPMEQHKGRIRCAYIDHRGQLYIGTVNGELYQFDEGDLELFANAGGYISNIQGDEAGNLWLSSGQSLVCITPEKQVRKINLDWGLGDNEFNIRSNYKDKNGVIYFGTSDGYISFLPEQMNKRQPVQPKLYVSDLKLFDKTVFPSSANGSILRQHINLTKKITLANDQNFISFTICAINYDSWFGKPYRCLYQLEDSDPNWYEVNLASNEISFTRLSMGKYILRIRLIEEDGNLLDSREIEIVVKPPFWLSGWMILMCLAVASLIGLLVYYIVRKQRNSQKLIEDTQHERDSLSYLIKETSRELRTPLNVLQTLKDSSGETVQDEEQAIFRRNIKRFEELVNQLAAVNPAKENQFYPKQEDDSSSPISENSVQSWNDAEFKVLLIDQDPDTRHILKKKLQLRFHVMSVGTCPEADKLIKSEKVDVIISDVFATQGHAGYELCRELKTNEKTKHIPVILISSDNSSEARIKGFDCGADAFLLKPIEIKELRLRLDNFLKSRDALRNYYSDYHPALAGKRINNADETFLLELVRYIHEHFENKDDELSIHNMTRHFCINRTQFYEKVKQLTSQAPMQFVLHLKMEEAKSLLMNSNQTLTEISYRLGYCNLNHFSRQFKESTGASPKEWRRKELDTPIVSDILRR